MTVTSSLSHAVLMARSLAFFLGMVLSTVVWGPIVSLSFPLPFKGRYWVSQQWTRFNVWWLRKTCGIDCRISGLEHLPTKPAIVLAKHQSTWETLFLHQFLPPIAWVIKRELLWVPFFGWALAILQPIAIDRKAGSSAVKQVIHQGQALLDRGRWVLIFPEGTRTAPGASGHYHSGGALLAAHTGYPILPVAHNAGDYWPRRGFLKYPGTIHLCFGPLIESKGRSARELNALVAEWIEATTASIRSPHSQQTEQN